MKLIKNTLLSVVATSALVFGGTAYAQADKAPNLDALLEKVRQGKVNETAAQRKREADFKRDKNKQAGVLSKAEATKKAEEARSVALEKKYKEQEVLVQQRREQLDERLGSLKELFGHLTSTAGDLRSNIENSIVSAQLNDRTKFLNDLIDKMNSETKLPSGEEIRGLIYELQRETVESGKVVKFTATVANPAGDKSDREVVRIGNYNLISDGKYLSYDKDTGVISELPRQPQKNHASALQSASDGFTKFGVDPTGPFGGDLLKALINSPDLVERWHQGNEVGYVITVVGIIALLIAIWRFIALSGTSAKVSSQLKNKTAKTNNPLGRVLKVAEDNPDIDPESLELKLEEAILKEKPGIESMLATLKIISMVAPLLGLLGTVTGMIIVFQAITVYGAGDPKAMAGGISGALVTTVLGLIVAIPTVLLHSFLNGKAQRITHVLEEQSAGIIAQKAER